MLQILQRNRGLVESVVDELIQRKSLSKQQFFNLVQKYGCLDPLPPNIIDVRNAKRAYFQEMMMAREKVTSGNAWDVNHCPSAFPYGNYYIFPVSVLL